MDRHARIRPDHGHLHHSRDASGVAHGGGSHIHHASCREQIRAGTLFEQRDGHHALGLCASSAFLHFYAKRFIAYHQHLTEANERLRDLSSHDPLTGVLNARAICEAGDLLIRVGAFAAAAVKVRRKGRSIGALYADCERLLRLPSWPHQADKKRSPAVGVAGSNELGESIVQQLLSLDTEHRRSGEVDFADQTSRLTVMKPTGRRSWRSTYRSRDSSMATWARRNSRSASPVRPCGPAVHAQHLGRLGVRIGQR